MQHPLSETEKRQQALPEPVWIYKHPLLTRLLHWAMVPVLGIMVWSGWMIYWAYDPYIIRIGGVEIIKFFPEWFYNALDLKKQLARGLAWHFAFMWAFLGIGMLYVAHLFASGQWRLTMPLNKRIFRQAGQMVSYTLGLRKDKPISIGKYNAAQRVAYTVVVVQGVLLFASGLAIWKPVQAGWLTLLLGGYEAARFIHFFVTLGLVMFTLVHLVQVVKAGWKNFYSMLTGWHKTQPFDATPLVAITEAETQTDAEQA